MLAKPAEVRPYEEITFELNSKAAPPGDRDDDPGLAPHQMPGDRPPAPGSMARPGSQHEAAASAAVPEADELGGFEDPSLAAAPARPPSPAGFDDDDACGTTPTLTVPLGGLQDDAGGFDPPEHPAPTAERRAQPFAADNLGAGFAAQAGGGASTPETFLEGFGDDVQLAAAAGLTFDSTGGTDASTSHAVGEYMDVDDNADC